MDDMYRVETQGQFFVIVRNGGGEVLKTCDQIGAEMLCKLLNEFARRGAMP